MEILHHCLNVSDVDRAVESYTTQFDFEETWGFESEEGETVNRYVAGEGGVELQLSETEGQADLSVGSLWDHIAFVVDDVDATFQQVENHGVVKEPADQPAAGARTAMIEDPDGHVIELVEPMED